jgi:hypothetical protein
MPVGSSRPERPVSRNLVLTVNPIRLLLLNDRIDPELLPSMHSRMARARNDMISAAAKSVLRQ